MIDSPIKQRKIDIKYAEKFGLPKSEILIKEYTCSLTVGISPKKNTGTMYISSRVSHTSFKNRSLIMSVCLLLLESVRFEDKRSSLDQVTQVYQAQGQDNHAQSVQKGSKRRRWFGQQQTHWGTLQCELSTSHINVAQYTFSFSDATEEDVEEVYVLIKHIFTGMEHEADDLTSPRQILNVSAKITVVRTVHL